MRVLVALEHHFARRADGRICTTGALDYRFWTRYTDVFEEVVVVARVGTTDDAGTLAIADGPRVSFHALPDYSGPWQFLRKRRQLEASVAQAVASADAFILRAPGFVSELAWKQLRYAGRPYACEVTGDPWDVFVWRNVPNLLTPLLRRKAAADLRAICSQAAAVAYVTRETLQRRYPPASVAFTTHYSSVELGTSFATEPQMQKRAERLQEVRLGKRPLRLGFIGSLAQMYKGPDVLLRAVAMCLQRGSSLEVAMVGEGRYGSRIARLNDSLQLRQHVVLLGHLPPGEAIADFLDGIDLFVLPSRTEGLPGAIIEAMARGCPCIATDVGGIGELLPGEVLVPPDRPDLLAARILEITADAQRMAALGARNLAASREYSSEQLQARRQFYQEVRRRSSVAPGGDLLARSGRPGS